MTKIRELKTENAEQELGARRNDAAILTRLDEILKGLRPWSEDQEPSSMFISVAPQLAVPTIALSTIMQCIALRGGRVPNVLTYKASSYTDSNPKLTAALNPVIGFEGKDRKGGKVIEARRVRLGRWAGQDIGDIPTVYENISLGEFYDRLLSYLAPCRYKQFDMSDFYLGLTRIKDQSATRAKAENYYLGLMALEQVYGLGVSMGSNPEFTQRVAQPALIKAAKILGVEPIVLEQTEYPEFGLLSSKDPGLAVATNFKNLGELEDKLSLRRFEDEK
jgi:hypothetical protein